MGRNTSVNKQITSFQFQFPIFHSQFATANLQVVFCECQRERKTENCRQLNIHFSMYTEAGHTLGDSIIVNRGK